jgi:hypothetical protein
MLLALAAGCATQPSPAPASRPAGVVSDPCADMLHDLAGQLLMFYAQHRRLPETLAELDPKAPNPACPVSKKPYMYKPDGVEVANLAGQVIVWEDVPCRPGVRWVIVMQPPTDGQPLHLNVLPLPIKN